MKLTSLVGRIDPREHTVKVLYQLLCEERLVQVPPFHIHFGVLIEHR